MSASPVTADLSGLTVASLIEHFAQHEVWRVIGGWPDYSISSTGIVRRDGTGRHLKQADVYGYKCVSLCRSGEIKNRRVHGLVARAFLGDPPFADAVVAHIDGTRDNNNVGNLRWATLTDNQADRIRHKTRTQGSDVYGAKLTEALIPEIRAKLSDGLTYPDIAAQFGVSVSTIYLINHNRIWRHA